MSLGLGIFLLVVGGICAFGVRDSWSALDLTAIGYVCMGAGVLTIILSLFLLQRRRTTAQTTSRTTAQAPGETAQTTVVEREDPPPPAV